LGENAVIALTSAAHTRNIFLALDLVFFLALKHSKTTLIGEFNDDSVNEQITRLVQASEQIPTIATIRRPFRRAGLWLDVTAQPFKIQVHDEAMNQTPDVKAACEPNVSVEELSRRGQKSQLTIINSEFLPCTYVLLDHFDFCFSLSVSRNRDFIEK
jgi:hypothetical protein